jgi:hypothetical protein
MADSAAAPRPAPRPWKVSDKVYAARVSWYDSKIIVGVATITHLEKLQATINPDNGESSGAFQYRSKISISEMLATRAEALCALRDSLLKKLESVIEEQENITRHLASVDALAAKEPTP